MACGVKKSVYGIKKLLFQYNQLNPRISSRKNVHPCVSLSMCLSVYKILASVKALAEVLTHSHTMTPFDAPGNKRFENTMGKGEISRNQQFLLFPQCLIPVYRTFCYFHQIQNCRLQTLSFWKSLKYILWEKVKSHSVTWL